MSRLLPVVLVAGCGWLSGSSGSASPAEPPASESPKPEARAPAPAPAPRSPEQGLAPGSWRSLAPGLAFGLFEAPEPSAIGDSRIRVLRVDPDHYALDLHAARLEDGGSRTARAWAERHDLVAAINPGMFEPDGTSTGWMRVDGTAVTSSWSADNTALLFDPASGDLPPARIVDRTCEDLPGLAARYRSGVQGIRMIDCEGHNVWSQQPRRWSHAVLGIDEDGRVLLIHARSPWSTHDFIEHLRALPLDLHRLQYAEGGPEATLYVRAGDWEGQWVGSFETGFHESDDNERAWPLPNVLGVSRPPLAGAR